LDELATLYDMATDLERVLLLLGLNGGFAQSKRVHLEKSELLLNADPPQVDYVRTKSSKRAGARALRCPVRGQV